VKYPDQLELRLRARNEIGAPVVIDLFAGCGGLSLGFEAAGFNVIGFEEDPNAHATYNYNLQGQCYQQTLTTRTPLPKCVGLIAGPPCQPFSTTGYQLGRADSRNGFEIIVAAIRRARPQFWLVENVCGLLSRNNHYFQGVLGRVRSLGYCVEYRIINSVELGVPQRRRRVVIIGHSGGFVWPRRSFAAVTARDAIGRTAGRFSRRSLFLSQSMEAYVRRYEQASACANPRDMNLDIPARTLTCRNLAGATGDMQRVLLRDGRRRRLTHREAARLQSFPDSFKFLGTSGSVFEQIGNAVPPLVALRLALACRRWLQRQT